MSDPPAGGDRGGGPRRTGESLGPQRMRVVLLLLTVFGIPLILMVSYLTMRGAAFRPPFDAQPGGRITGRVVHANGDAAVGVPVAVLTHRRDRRPEPLEEAVTATDGTFGFDVPPLDGCYVVTAGGGTWIEVAREVTLTAAEPPDLRFVLHPGSELALTLERRDGRPVRGGSYELVREEGRLWFDVPSAALPGTFEGSVLKRGGLKPGRWTLRVELDDHEGTEAEFELELAPGRTELRSQAL